MAEFMTDSTVSPVYPVRLTIDYPDRDLNRLTSAFRVFLALPVMFLISLVGGSSSTGFLTAPLGLMLLFRRKYPRWWFDWHLQLIRFQTRALSYALMLDDRYPSSDEAQGVHLEMDYPVASRDLNRWLPLVKWLLAIPHYIILIILWIGVIFASIGAWFAILFTARYPRTLFAFIVGVLRWQNRVTGYAFTLLTDKYPPFRLAP